MMIFHGANKRKRSGKHLWLMILALLLGCDDMKSSESNKSAISLGHGSEIIKDGIKYRVYVISGMRFEAPTTDITAAIPYGSNGVNGFRMSFFWPDIPRGQAPGIKPSLEAGVNVLVYPDDRTEDPYEWFTRIGFLDPAKYIIREDHAMGLRFYHPIDAPLIFSYAVAMDKDKGSLTPWRHQPIVIDGNRLSFRFLYSKGILVVVDAYGRTLVPHWKQIYLGVLKTLDQYAERKP
jgi:hypothetical protein